MLKKLWKLGKLNHADVKVFFLETYLAWKRRNEYLGDASCSNDDGLGDSSEGHWALPESGVALSTFCLAPQHPYEGDCITVVVLLMKEKGTGNLVESDHPYDRHVSRLRHLSLGVTKWIHSGSWNVWMLSHVSQHCAHTFLLFAGKQCNHHLKCGQREKSDNYSLMLLNKKAGYLRWILTLSKIVI